MTTIIILTVMISVMYLTIRQKSLQARSGSASRLIKMMERCDTPPEHLISVYAKRELLTLLNTCDSCIDHMACDDFLISRGRHCAGFCPNRAILDRSNTDIPAVRGR